MLFRARYIPVVSQHAHWKLHRVFLIIAIGILFFIAVVAAGCSGGGGGGYVGIGPQPSPSPTRTLMPTTKLFVLNRGGSSITEFPLTSSGNVSPNVTISGGSTTLSAPVPLALDSMGRIFTANDSTSSIIIFSPGATGNVAPSGTISGNMTGLDFFVYGLATDASNRLYATSFFPCPRRPPPRCTPANSVNVFASGASGNVAPIQRLSGNTTALNQPWGIVVDAAGRIYVANYSSNSITVYAAGATGDVAPITTISGTNTGLAFPVAIALDANGQIYVTNRLIGGNSSVTVYAAGATGNAAPVATISGANTGLTNPFGIALDRTGRLYVVNADTNSVTVYAPGATGNATPVAAISGANTSLNEPLGIAVH